MCIKTLFGAVENIICRDRQKPRIHAATHAGEILRTARIHALGPGSVAFTTINIGPGRAIDHRIGRLARDHVRNFHGVADIERLPIVSNNFVAERTAMLNARTSNQTTRSRNENLVNRRPQFRIELDSSRETRDRDGS